MADMNRVILSGRLVKDPEIVQEGSSTKTAVTRYTLAVQKPIKPEVGADVDYISCIAFGNNAVFAAKWFEKGTKVMVLARIQTGSYTNKDGCKIYTTDIIVEEQEFGENKSNSESFKPAAFRDELDQEQPVEPPENKKGRRKR